jgi:septum formation protein
MALWLAAEPLVLASRSGARRALLQAAGLPVEVRPAEIDERAIESALAGGGAGAVAAILARTKASAVAAALPGRLVLGADQTLSLGAARFSKPATPAAARDQLRALAGRTHELHSALAFVRDGEILFEHAEDVRMTMRPLSEAFIDRYIDAAGSAVTASVGAYQVEGLGIHLFERIEGDYFAILGLPLLAVLNFLRREGCLAG